MIALAQRQLPQRFDTMRDDLMHGGLDRWMVAHSIDEYVRKAIVLGSTAHRLKIMEQNHSSPRKTAGTIWWRCNDQVAVEALDNATVDEWRRFLTNVINVL